MSGEESEALGVWEEVQRLKAAGVAGMVVTVAAVRGSVPTEAGAKILVSEAGLVAGDSGWWKGGGSGGWEGAGDDGEMGGV